MPAITALNLKLRQLTVFAMTGRCIFHVPVMWTTGGSMVRRR